MKKRIWVMVFTVLFLMTSVASASSLGSRTLRNGMSGDDVRELQQLLKTGGFFSVNPTGFFGSITVGSVRDFQRARGLTVDGIAGPQTISNLKGSGGNNNGTTTPPSNGNTFHRTLRHGMSGTDVTSLQNSLKTLSHFPGSTASTGYFGNVTLDAVRSFQRAQNLTSDGIAGPKTFSALEAALGGSQVKPPSRGSEDRTEPAQQYKTYTVAAGDTIWSIAIKNSVLERDIMSANPGISPTGLRVGQQLRIPIINIPVKPTPSDKHGEYLDWWTEVQYLLPINAVFTITDFHTGISFKAKRTYGANHADVEPLTAADTAIMLGIWTRYHSNLWAARPIIVEINGRKIAASANGMFHAGVDALPANVVVNNRSGNYGTGPNLDAVKGNNADGHFCIHFLNSRTHGTNSIDASHQANVIIAAGK